ncbi:MAG: hypothetical protein ACU0CO_11720 [Shimia sp.]
MADLDARLLAAHAAGDGAALAALYAEAAAGAEGERSWFYLTHAYVFALEAGLEAATGYGEALVAAGRL